MSVKASICLGTSVVVVSTKTGIIPGQVILQRNIIKNDIFSLVVVGRHPEFLSRSRVKAGPLALC